MGDPGSFRDATQIVVPVSALSDIRADVEAEFRVTVLDDGEYARIIGSPLVIKEVGDFLARHGISLP